MKDLSKENSIYFSDAELTQAACAVRDALAASLPDNDEIDHQFSAGFVSGMNILIRKNRAKNTFRKIMQSAAMILLSLLIGSGIWLATDTDAMADFSRWVRSVYENNFLYDFFGDMSSKPLPTLEFAWLPDGYTLAASEIDVEGGALLFSSEDGEDIVFGYGFMYSGKSFFVFGDNLTEEELHVNEFPAKFYLDPAENKANILWWVDEANEVFYYLNAISAKDEMLKIAENVLYITD